MTQGIGQTFACPHCGKRFTWHARFAGKKLSCTCGSVFEPTLGLEAVGVAREAYDVGSDPVISNAPATPPVKRDIAAIYPRRKKAAVQTNASDSNVPPIKPVRDLYLPSVLLLAGMAIRVVQVLHATHSSMPAGVLLVAIDVFLSASVMLGGAYVAVMILGVEFGEIPITMLKLAATAVFAGGIASLAAGLDHMEMSLHGLLLGIYVTVFLYFIFFCLLFELDLLEALSTVVIVFVLQLIVQIALFAMFNSFMGKS